MTRLTRWMDRHIDPSQSEHLVDDADEAMHPLVAAMLLTIVLVAIIAAITWFALPAGDGELAPVPGTTTTIEGAVMGDVFCAHCQGRVFKTRIADDTSLTGPFGTWSHIATTAELNAGLEWCDTPEPRTASIEGAG